MSVCWGKRVCEREWTCVGVAESVWVWVGGSVGVRVIKERGCICETVSAESIEMCEDESGDMCELGW